MSNRSAPRWRRLLKLLVVCIALFVVINAVLYAVYHNRTYPRTFVAGKAAGNVSFDRLPTRLNAQPLLPASLEVRYGQERKTAATADLGIRSDDSALQTASRYHGWLPLWDFVRRHDVSLSLRVDDGRLQQQLTQLTAGVATPAHDARIVQGDDGFSMVKAVNGRQLDTTASKATLLAAVSGGQRVVNLVIRNIPPPVTDASLSEPFKKLQTAQNLSISYNHGTNRQAVPAADITGWYRKDGNSFSPATTEIRASITSIARRWQREPQNLDAAVSATQQALDTGKPLDFSLQTTAYTPAKTITYCAAVRGVDASYLPQLERKLATTYADSRGWSLGGPVSFVHGTTGCTLNVWLSAADKMSSFGAICDSQWSCTVSPNVIINFDRWRNASDSWNAAGLNINDYRSMAINHETGHWLGFNHVLCPSPGKPAPVMQQQSINLGGCVFSPWPDATEQAALRTQLGL